MTRIIEATATREGKWWEIRIPELDQVTATKKLSQVQEYATDLAEAVLDAPEGSVEVRVSYTLPESIKEPWEAAAADKRVAEEAAMRAAEKSRAVVEALKAEGYTARESAVMLGISHQRVTQLLKSGTTHHDKTA